MNIKKDVCDRMLRMADLELNTINTEINKNKRIINNAAEMNRVLKRERIEIFKLIRDLKKRK